MHNLSSSVWEILHDEYKRTFDPEADMNTDRLRTYNTLTDALGFHNQKRRKAEQDKLPEKLARKAERTEQLEAKRERRRKLYDAQEALQGLLNGAGGDRDAILALVAEAWDVEPETPLTDTA